MTGALSRFLCAGLRNQAPGFGPGFLKGARMIFKVDRPFLMFGRVITPEAGLVEFKGQTEISIMLQRGFKEHRPVSEPEPIKPRRGKPAVKVEKDAP